MGNFPLKDNASMGVGIGQRGSKSKSENKKVALKKKKLSKGLLGLEKLRDVALDIDRRTQECVIRSKSEEDSMKASAEA